MRDTNSFAFERKDAVERFESLAPQIAEHFLKCIFFSESSDIFHWKKEIAIWLTKIKNLRLKEGLFKDRELDARMGEIFAGAEDLEIQARNFIQDNYLKYEKYWSAPFEIEIEKERGHIYVYLQEISADDWYEEAYNKWVCLMGILKERNAEKDKDRPIKAEDLDFL